MAWFNGTFDYTIEEFEREFPVSVTKEIRSNTEGTCLAIINDFSRGTRQYDLADPKMEENDVGRHVFFHTFLGNDRVVAKRVVRKFLSLNSTADKRVKLFRRENDRLFQYADGLICSETFTDQDKFRSLFDDITINSDVFFLPLKVFLKEEVSGRVSSGIYFDSVDDLFDAIDKKIAELRSLDRMESF